MLTPRGTDGLFLAVKHSKELATKVRHATSENRLIKTSRLCLASKLKSLDENLDDACLVLGEEYEPIILTQYETVR